jgi:nucleoside-diphosphate-sugar epimerase
MTCTLITGVSGFTGRYLAMALSQAGHEVHGLANHGADENIAGVSRMHRCDLMDAPGLQRIMRDLRPDHIVHLAAISFVAHGDVDEMYRTNILGTRHLLDAIQTAGLKPRSILVASSANVYGNARDGVIDETTPPAPANDYGVTKTALEYVCGIYAASLPLVVIRPFNYTGVGQSRNFLIPKIVDHILQGAHTIELGNIDIARDFSDVRTVVDVYVRLLSTPAAIGQTLNVCSGRAVSLRDIIDALQRLSGHQMDVQINPAFVRANEVKSLCGSRARLESVIGAVSMPPLDETLMWMLQSPAE